VHMDEYEDTCTSMCAHAAVLHLKAHMSEYEDTYRSMRTHMCIWTSMNICVHAAVLHLKALKALDHERMHHLRFSSQHRGLDLSIEA
jgi:hypothetical protein